jgi:undecaprenyl-diphosphatase
MDPFLTAIILGIVEGLTEFLPVSSTGHLIMATELLGYDAEKWSVFNIAIQPGAILAVVAVYWRTFWEAFIGLFRWDPKAVAFVRNLLVAFLPAVVIGYFLDEQIEALLESATVVAWAFIVGGVGILAVERLANPRESGGVANVTLRQAIAVGLVQCLAMIPGMSRSGATIMGAMAVGIDRKTAAEFSFFLALPTLTGATVLQLVKHRDALDSGQYGLIALGAAVSFVVALAVIRLFVGYVSRHGFAPFAWYRIVVGAAALIWLALR